MDKLLFKLFQQIEDAEPPASLHALTMRRVLFRRAQRIIVIASIFATCGLAYSLYHLYARAIDLDLFSAVRSITSTIDFDLDSIQDSFSVLTDSLPINSLVVACLNSLTFGILLYATHTIRRMRSNEFFAL